MPHDSPQIIDFTVAAAARAAAPVLCSYASVLIAWPLQALNAVGASSVFDPNGCWCW